MVTANEILVLCGVEALTWFHSVDETRISLTDGFNWHGLAEYAVSRSRNADTDNESLAWAAISTSIYDRLASEAPEGSFDVSSMYCRIAMIARHGSIPNDPICDSNLIFTWFRLHLPTDYHGVLALLDRVASEDWQTIVVDVLRPLRGIKNRLNVINHLAQYLEIPDDIGRYQMLMERLP